MRRFPLAFSFSTLALAALAVPALAFAGPPATGPDTVAPPPTRADSDAEDADDDDATPSLDPTLVQEGPAREFLWLLLPGLQVEPQPMQLVLFEAKHLSLKVRPLSLNEDPTHQLHLDAGFVRPVPETPRIEPGLAKMTGKPNAAAGTDAAAVAGTAFELTVELGDEEDQLHPTLSFYVSAEMHEVAGARSPAGDPARAPISGAGFLGFALRF